MAFNRILDFSNGLDFNLGFFFCISCPRQEKICPVQRVWSDLEKFIDQEIDHFQRDQYNNDPFQESTVTILQQVFK